MANITKEELAARRDIDALTFCRIKQLGFENLSQNQKGLIEQALEEHMQFRAEYGEMLDNPLSSFGINGVSMSWDSKKVQCIQGVYIRGTTLALLRQTGLCCRVAP